MRDLPQLSDVADERVLAWPRADAGALADATEAAGWVVFSLPAPATNRMTEDLVESVEHAARALYPAWLPEAAGIGSPGGGGEDAVRFIARRTAESGALFAPYLEALAVTALKGQTDALNIAVPSEVRLRECYKLFLRSYGVSRRYPPLSTAASQRLASSAQSASTRGSGASRLASRSSISAARLDAVSFRAAALNSLRRSFITASPNS